MKKHELPAVWSNLWALPATTVMVSCIGKGCAPNIITLGACGVACARPPLLSLAISPQRYSLGLIKETGDFVINIPAHDQADVTDWCGSISGREVDKFAESGLTPQASVKVSSPLIGECPVNCECTVWRIVPCGSHELVLGELQLVHIDDSAINESGDALDPAKFNPLVSLQNEYWNLGRRVGHWGQTRD